MSSSDVDPADVTASVDDGPGVVVGGPVDVDLAGVVGAADVTPSSAARLADDVGVEAVAGMRDRFVALLPGRVARLGAALAAGEAPELRDAALSLSCSATMLGAHRLAALCDALRGGDLPAEPVRELEDVAAATCRALAEPTCGPRGPAVTQRAGPSASR